MKVKFEEDRFGRFPLAFTGYKSLSEIHDYLFNNYQGYHFCILFDETKDEWEPYGKTLVYFSDEALFGIAVVALPAGIITAGYMDEIGKKTSEEEE